VATVLIIGASRGIGLETVKAALEAGHSVRALARSPRRIAVDHPKLKKWPDALEMATVKRALSGADVVIQSLGVSAGPEIIFKPTQLFSNATRMLITAMEETTAAAAGGFFITWLFTCCWGVSMTTRTCRSASSVGASSTG
jgi:putative NADH-flavin reductase